MMVPTEARGVKPFETGGTGSCELHAVVAEKLRTLEEQSVLLMPRPSLQPRETVLGFLWKSMLPSYHLMLICQL